MSTLTEGDRFIAEFTIKPQSAPASFCFALHADGRVSYSPDNPAINWVWCDVLWSKTDATESVAARIAEWRWADYEPSTHVMQAKVASEGESGMGRKPLEDQLAECRATLGLDKKFDFRATPPPETPATKTARDMWISLERQVRRLRRDKK